MFMTIEDAPLQERDATEPIDLKAAQALMDIEERRRYRESPRTKRDLEGWLAFAIGLPMAAIYEPNIAPLAEQRHRFEHLWQNDPIFHAAVSTAIKSTMQLFDDYERNKQR